jgi:hypothetical protein
MTKQQAALEMPAKAEIVVAPPPTPLMILQEGVKQGVSIETLTQLLGLQERFEANQARKAFDEAFAAFKAEAPKLERSKEVSFGSNKTAYKYTPLDVIANTLGPILAKHGLSYNWKQESTKESITVTCILRHTQGHAIENQLSAQSDPSGSKNAIQAIGSAVSYLRRYTLLGVLGLATSDEDTDGVTMQEAADFIALIEESETIDDLRRNYRSAVNDALKKQNAKAVELYMKARVKREATLRA